MDHIRFENIEVTAWAMPELYFACLDAEHQVQDVAIMNLHINGRRVRGLEDTRFTIQPFVERLSVEYAVTQHFLLAPPARRM